MEPFTVIPLQQSRPENMKAVKNGPVTFLTWTMKSEGKSDLYLQIIDLQGNPVFEESGKKINYGDGPAYPTGGVAMTPAADGGVFVLYGDTREDPDDMKQQPFIYKIDASGDLVSTAEGIAIPDSYGATKYSFVNTGSSILVAYDINAEGTYTAYTHLCRIDSDGTPEATVTLPGGNAGIVPSGDGFLTACVLNNNIMAQLYDAELNPVWDTPLTVKEKTAMWGALTVYSDGNGGMYLPYEYTDELYQSHFPLAHISATGNIEAELLQSMSPKEGYNINTSSITPIGDDGFCIFSSIRQGWSGDHLMYAATYSGDGTLQKSVELGRSGFKFEFPAVLGIPSSEDMLLEVLSSTDYSSRKLEVCRIAPDLTEVWKQTLNPGSAISQVNTVADNDNFTNYFVDAPSSEEVGAVGIRLDYSGQPLLDEVSEYRLDIVLVKAGTLASKITDEQMYTTESMRLRGPINSDDVRLIRDMAGVKNVAIETDGILSRIDLSGAYVVEGGEPYMEYYDTDVWDDVQLTTVNGEFPAYFLSKCSITEIIMPQNTTSIGHHALADCGALTAVDIPAGVEQIGKMAFAGSGLVSPVVPENVTSIGSYAFWGCAHLTGIRLPENLTVIPEGLLQQTSLNEFTLGPAVTKIHGNAFKDCTYLTKINGLDQVTEIERYAFNNCYNLEEVTFSPDLEEIGNEAFENCLKLGDITIPASVIYIGNLAFNNCGAMTAITVEDNNTSYKSIDGILYTADGLCAVVCPAGHSPEVTIADGVATIGASCFEMNANLTRCDAAGFGN